MDTSAEMPGTSAVREAVLDNGLRVLVQEVHTAPLASVWCWYKVGSKDEVTGQTGVSHWVEHMNFKGTKNIPRDQVKGIIERFGGSWNGYTWIDHTTYVETATRDAVDRMLFIEAERMANCLYDPADCESERTVIIAELQGGENDPDQLLDTEVTAAAFKMHPYRNPTIGWLSDLRSMTRDEIYRHYRRYYIPNNAVLVVVGDVTADDVLLRVERQFGGIPSSPLPPRLNVEEPEQLGERRVSICKEGTTAYLKLAYRAPAFKHEDCFPMVVLDAVLTGAKGLNLWASFRTSPPQRSTRLYRALVEQRLASSVSGAIVPTEHPFLYTISMTVNETAKVAGVEAAALEALEHVVRDGVTEAELNKAKNQLRARLVFDDESVTHIAHQLGYFETISSFEACRTLLSRVMAVTLEDVARVARRYLVSSNRTVGWFDPAPRGTARGEAGFAQGFRVASADRRSLWRRLVGGPTKLSARSRGVST